MLERLVDHLDFVQKQMLALPIQDQSVNSVGWVIRNVEQSLCCAVDLHKW